MDGIKSINNIKQSSPMSDEILPTNGEPMLEYEMGAVIHGEGAVTNLDFHRYKSMYRFACIIYC